MPVQANQIATFVNFDYFFKSKLKVDLILSGNFLLLLSKQTCLSGVKLSPEKLFYMVGKLNCYHRSLFLSK